MTRQVSLHSKRKQASQHPTSPTLHKPKENDTTSSTQQWQEALTARIFHVKARTLTGTPGQLSFRNSSDRGGNNDEGHNEEGSIREKRKEVWGEDTHQVPNSASPGYSQSDPACEKWGPLEDCAHSIWVFPTTERTRMPVPPINGVSWSGKSVRCTGYSTGIRTNIHTHMHTHMQIFSMPSYIHTCIHTITY